VKICVSPKATRVPKKLCPSVYVCVGLWLKRAFPVKLSSAHHSPFEKLFSLDVGKKVPTLVSDLPF
jgi:hypothetical protein